MRTLLKLILKILAKIILIRYTPRIIAVTGSVGKTGSRLAIVSVLAERWRVGQGKKNFNNEIGLPLAILGEDDSGYRNIFLWLRIFSRALKKIIIKQTDYPQVLVLEYGVDHPGDMDYLLSIARPNISVVTAISEAHLEFFGLVSDVAKEKGKLVAALPPDGLAVLNIDFPLVASMKAKTKVRVIGYGQSEMADIKLTGINISQSAEGRVVGMSFRLSIAGSTVPILIRGTVGWPIASYAAAAAAVGQAMGLTVLEITRGLEKYQAPPGRLKLIAGWQGSLLIDDTYNSSPQAAKEALKILEQFPVPVGSKKWAVLGDMLELGEDSEKYHRQLGELVAQLKSIDYLITIGQESVNLLAAARESGFLVSNSWQTQDTTQATVIIKQRLKTGDVVLVKGSQGVRCERVVKELIAEPEKASELLVRQSSPWV